MRRDSWRSVPRMKRPPRPTTSSRSRAVSALYLAVPSSKRFSQTRQGGLVYFGRSGRPVRGRRRRLGGRPDFGLGQHLGVSAEENVRPAAGHVGGDGDRAPATGLGDDVRLALVLLGVEDVVRHAPALEEGAHHLALGDGDGAHQHRLALLVQLLNLLHRRFEFLALGLVNHVLQVLADHVPVGGHHADVEVVDFGELLRLGVGGAGHARQLGVHAEVVLERDGGQRLVLVLDADALFGLDGLVQAVGPAAAGHEAAGEFVHDEDFAVLHHVVPVALVEGVRPKRLLHVVQGLHLARVIEVGDAEPVLDFVHAGVGEGDAAGFLVERVVLVRHQAGNDPVHDVVLVGGVLGGAGNNERRAGLVNEDGVHLVDNGVVELPLDVVLEPELHVVAQVVEAELVVLPVGNVRAVRCLAVRVIQVVDDAAHGAGPGSVVDAAHPLRVAPGEVVVHRHNVDAAPAQRVEVAGQGGGERLAFAGAHFGDAALVKKHSADELDVEVALADGAPGRLAHQREGLEEDVIERAALGHLLFEPGGVGGEVGRPERLHLGLERINFRDLGPSLLELALILGANDLLQRPLNHVCQASNEARGHGHPRAAALFHAGPRVRHEKP